MNSSVAHADRRSSDRGSTLLIAIGFVMMIGTIAAGLASLVISATDDRGTLVELRNTEYAADGAIEAAIAEVRGRPGGLAEGCGNIVGSNIEQLNEVSIRVDWRDACGVVRGSDGTVVAQRNVIFAACPDVGAPVHRVHRHHPRTGQLPAGGVGHGHRDVHPDMEREPMIVRLPRLRRRPVAAPTVTDRDRGFTLLEVVLTIVLGGAISGVVIAALLTSMSVVHSTNEEVADSIDAALITAYLFRDRAGGRGDRPGDGGDGGRDRCRCADERRSVGRLPTGRRLRRPLQLARPTHGR